MREIALQPGAMTGIQRKASHALLEMLSNRFGAFEAIANSSIKLVPQWCSASLLIPILPSDRVAARCHPDASCPGWGRESLRVIKFDTTNF